MRSKCTIIGAITGGILLCLIIAITNMFLDESLNLEQYSQMFLGGAGAGALIGFMASPYIKDIAEGDQVIREEKQKQQDRLRLISSGKWEFPIDTFYKKCVSEKATAVTNKLNFKKMMLIAKNIIDTEGIPQEYAHLYYDEEKVKYYFKAGKENAQSAKKKAAEEEKLRKITPQEAKLTDEMKEEILSKVKA